MVSEPVRDPLRLLWAVLAGPVRCAVGVRGVVSVGLSVGEGQHAVPLSVGLRMSCL